MIGTGINGFLLKSTKFSTNVHEYISGQSYNANLFLHFSGPSDIYDFKDTKRMARSMIKDTVEIVDFCYNHNIKLVFASSMAAISPCDEYGYYKRSMEQYISATLDNYLILRIPRVYGKNRQKGLMKRIAVDDIDDWNHVVEYVDITTLSEWLINNIKSTGIMTLQPNKKNTIKQIKDIYEI